MRTLDEWLSLYAVSHQNKTNKNIHNICVPAIMFSIIGLISTIPFPFIETIYLNWAIVLAIPCLIFYFLLSIKVALLIFILNFLPMLALSIYLNTALTFSSAWLYFGIFVIAWIFQFIGHKIEGKKPSFLEDLSFLLIGPIWVLKNFIKI